MTDKELMEEMRQDAIYEARQEELHEYKMRTDDDYFYEDISEDMNLLENAINKVKKLHESYDREFKIEEIIFQ